MAAFLVPSVGNLQVSLHTQNYESITRKSSWKGSSSEKNRRIILASLLPSLNPGNSSTHDSLFEERTNAITFNAVLEVSNSTALANSREWISSQAPDQQGKEQDCRHDRTRKMRSLQRSLDGKRTCSTQGRGQWGLFVSTDPIRTDASLRCWMETTHRIDAYHVQGTGGLHYDRI